MTAKDGRFDAGFSCSDWVTVPRWAIVVGELLDLPLDVPDESIQATYGGRITIQATYDGGITIWGLTEDDLKKVLDWAEENYGFVLLDYVDASWSAQSLTPVRNRQRVDSAQRAFESIMETKINGKNVIKGGLN